ncbi:hypothetical protein ACFPOG_12250 [Paenibacillus aestuarii]|uniref:Uncharacterized protein n=1 Tax=Paenibacillus aestuarii TaxID=516965 RepID=A0ABW0K7R7_9BACL
MKEYAQRFKNHNLNMQLLIIMLPLTIVTFLLTAGHESLMRLTTAFAIFSGILLAWHWFNDTLAKRLTVILLSIGFLSETILRPIFPHALDKIILYLAVASMLWWFTQAAQKSTRVCITWMVFMPLVAFVVSGTLSTYIPIPDLLILLVFPVCWIGMSLYADVYKMERVHFISAFCMFVIGALIFYAMGYISAGLSELNTPEMTEVAKQLQTFHLYSYWVTLIVAFIFFICWYIVMKRKPKPAH